MARKFGGTVKKTDTVLVTSVDLASADVTGVLPVANGGTGSGSYTDGQLLIGSTAGNTLTKATLTAGSNITITNGSGSITIAASSGGGLTNFTESTGTYSSQTYVALVPASGTNVNAVFGRLGTGYLSAQIPTGTSSGGNQRGIFSVDWQTKRSNANQVASGYYSVVAGGYSNKATNNYSSVTGGFTNTASGLMSSVVGGTQCTASGSTTIAGGKSNTASGTSAVTVGGAYNAAGGDYSSVLGGLRGTTRSIYGCSAYASGRFATDGDAQGRKLVLRALTTDATATVLTTNQSAAGTSNQVVLPNNSAYTFKALVTSHRTDTVSGYTHRASWSVEGIAIRDANAASTLVSATINTIYNTPGWTLAVATDTTNGCVKFTFTGEAAKTIRTVAVVETCEVTS